MRGGKQQRRATKLDVLELIKIERMITKETLMKTFGYTSEGAQTKLRGLEQEDLIQRDDSGHFAITNLGDRRLNYCQLRVAKAALLPPVKASGSVDKDPLFRRTA